MSEPHPEDFCEKCKHPNIVWFAPSELWNKYAGDKYGILCPVCFVQQAEEAGYKKTWKLQPEFFSETRQAAEVFHPGEFIRDEMDARGWSIETLVGMSGLNRNVLEELIAKHRAVTPVWADCIGKAFGTGREV